MDICSIVARDWSMHQIMSSKDCNMPIYMLYSRTSHIGNIDIGNVVNYLPNIIRYVPCAVFKYIRVDILKITDSHTKCGWFFLL